MTSSLFGSVSSTFSSWTSSFQKETEQGFPGTFKRFNDFSQTIQAKARELPQNIANLPGSFEAERKNFIKDNTDSNVTTKTNERGAELVAPWQGYGPYEKEMKQRILALSKDQRNFLFSPPEDTSFQFDLKAYGQTAKAALQYDQELAKMRFLLVPQQVQEPIFWRNYFYRVTLEKQAVLSSTDIDPMQHESDEEEKNDVLFDYPSDGEETDDKKDENANKKVEPKSSSKKINEPSTAKSQETPSTKTETKKTEENFEDMEEWERELRKAANEAH
ncbi:hypothetical protein BDA99DRAFT_305234 [Phascolomyces articulosus]|uniref:BSD domain-containing protein n=1 Tax=Phascolomyces articulosus TaxID=60185 RepID=A0AAD5KNC0_9FUNG|nr:hypothetical protein BDA99DRAFT_305234 [Phascolomyces articulosus]